MAAKITAAHLTPFAAAFDAALREGAITIQQAMEFCDTTFNATLEQRVRHGEHQHNKTRAHRGVSNTATTRDVRDEPPAPGGVSILD